MVKKTDKTDEIVKRYVQSNAKKLMRRARTSELAG